METTIDYVKNTWTFHSCFPNYPRGEGGLVDWTNICKHNITDKGSAGNISRVG